jgi:hypothetical protein
MNLKYSTLELLNVLWEKLYPNVSRDYISEIASVYLNFWTKSSALIPCGWMVNSNNSLYNYWNCVNITTQGALKYAADIVIRISLLTLH